MRELKFLLILSFISLIAIPTALGSTAPVVYVATDGSGDYNCDGTDDHVQINQALDFVASHSDYTTVHLKSGTYIIDDTIFIHSNIILEGESGTIVKLEDECGWVRHKGLIEPSSEGAHNFVIRGFEVNGNLDKQTYIVTEMGEPCKHGRGYLDLFRADRDSVTGDHSAPYDFEIYDMYFHDGANDGIRVRGDRSDAGIKIYDNTFYRTGHDDIFIMSSKNVYIDNNAFTWIYGDCGIRIENTDDVIITNNVMDSINPPKNPQGLSGIYLSYTSSGSTMRNYVIAYNEIHDTREMGILMCNRVGGTYDINKVSDAHIHHNILYNCGTNTVGSYSGGIWVHGWNGVVIENNVIDGSKGDAIAHRIRFSGNTQSGYTTTVRNNIITNTVESSSLSSSGYGINNYLSSTHSFILENNDVWNNDNGNYINVNSHSSDVNVNPLFVDRANRDYRLQSNSPIVDAGIGAYADGDSIPSTPEPSNKAPVLDYIGGMSVSEGSTLSFVTSASDADGDSLTYSASGLPSGATFDAASGRFVWTPAIGQEGTYSVTFEVSDGELTDSEVVSIVVSPEGTSAGTVDSMYVNRLRESSPDSTLSGDSYVDVGNLAGVGDYREVMWFDLSEYNEMDTVTSATLSLSWYYPESSPRNQDTVVEIYRAADWDPAQVSWNERASGVPWVHVGGDWYDRNGVAQGSTPYASITFSGSNVPDNGVYEFDVTELVQEYVSGEHENNGFFIKARTENDNYIAFDGTANELKKPKLKVVHSTKSNLAPVMDPVGSKTVDEGSTLNFIVSASDEDGDSLTYSAAGLPAGATFDTTSGEFTWTPSDVQAGTYGVRFEVNDGELADSEAIIITVNAINNDPSNNLPVITAFSPANDAVFEEGETINIKVTASDADGQELDYLLKIDGVTVSTTSGYAWTTDHSNAGAHTLEAVVSDGSDQVTAQHVLTVIKLHPRWDVNRDGVVNILDVTIVAQNLGTENPHPSWDVNVDGEVNIQDLTIVAHYFGEKIEM